MLIEIKLILPNENGIVVSGNETIEINEDNKQLPQIMTWMWENVNYGWRYNYHFKK